MARKNWIVLSLALCIGLIGGACSWWLMSSHAVAVPPVRAGMSYTEIDRLMQRSGWYHDFWSNAPSTYTWTDENGQYLDVDFDVNYRCTQMRYWRR
jgi:hypothetical protein